MIEYIRYLVIFIVGAIGDIFTNMWVSSMKNPSGALGGLKYFYTTLPWYNAAFWAGLLFVLIYIISDWVYEIIRPHLPVSWINYH